VVETCIKRYTLNRPVLVVELDTQRKYRQRNIFYMTIFSMLKSLDHSMLPSGSGNYACCPV
jgi:hypothetical protein